MTIFPVDDSVPTLASIATTSQELLEHRTELLQNPGEHGIKVKGEWGPTELYNLYDNRECQLDGIEKLRGLHVDLFTAVLDAYGWTDLSAKSRREHWGFERPWLDRTPRFVPPEPVRREVYQRMGELNAARYEEELGMFLERAVQVMKPAKAMSCTEVAKGLEAKFCPGADGTGKSIDKGVLEAALKLGIRRGLIISQPQARSTKYLLAQATGGKESGASKRKARGRTSIETT